MHDNKGKKNQINGYNLLRAWFDFHFENPSKVKPIHATLFAFIIDSWNRFGQKEEFGLPTYNTMELLGINNRKTFYKALKKLKEFGFIQIISNSTNQNQSRIIKINPACVNIAQPHTKALDRANTQASHKRNPHKQTIEQLNHGKGETSKSKDQIDIENWIAKHYPEVCRLKYQLTPKNWEYLTSTYGRKAVEDILAKMDNYKPLLEKYNSVYRTAFDWLKKDYGKPEKHKEDKTLKPADPRGKTM